MVRALRHLAAHHLHRFGELRGVGRFFGRTDGTTGAGGVDARGTRGAVAMSLATAWNGHPVEQWALKGLPARRQEKGTSELRMNFIVDLALCRICDGEDEEIADSFATQ
ncbi:MAG TPA: hypothetical protein VMK12_20335 [Anaeromyxobacteraceae bacterium]|nr:hypothetical protein [Anaeromyxobacteraceae bacterium]